MIFGGTWLRIAQAQVCQAHNNGHEDFKAGLPRLQKNPVASGDSKNYHAQNPPATPDLPAVIKRVLQSRALIEPADTIYLLVDNCTLQDIGFWPAFQPWWSSRRQLFGPAQEYTEVIWFQIDERSGQTELRTAHCGRDGTHGGIHDSSSDSESQGVPA